MGFNKIGLTPKWQSFKFEFNPTEDGDNARIQFDVDANEASVELSGVGLTTVRQ